MRLTVLVICLATLSGCAASMETMGAPGRGATVKPGPFSEGAVTIRAEYFDGRPAKNVTLRVMDIAEGVWWPPTNESGMAPVITAGLPLVHWAFVDESGSVRQLLPARRHVRPDGSILYVVTIPRG